MNTLSNYYVRVLSLRSSVIHVFLTEPWHSCHVLFSCERAASSVLEPCALSSACLVSCWTVMIGSRHSCLEFRFRFGHSCSTFCLVVWACDLEFSRLHALLSTCVLLCCTQFVFLSAVCIHVMSCVNTWLMSFLISCVFVSCFAHGWWIVCWPCACVFVLCEHVASVLVFCVPSFLSLMSIVLTPPILLPDYWLICPTCLSSLPSTFAPFIFSLCLQSCGSSSSNVSCPALSCLALPSLASCPVFPLRSSFSLFVLFYFWLIKPITLQYWVLASSLHPQPWHIITCLNNMYI